MIYLVKVEMNIKELESELIKRRVNPLTYSLTGGLPSDALCIEKENNKWNIYYSERGNKDYLQSFTDESEACKFFLDTILEDSSVIMK